MKHVSNHAVCLTSKGNVEEDDGIGSLVINTTVTVSNSSHADGKSQIKFYVDFDARYLIMPSVMEGCWCVNWFGLILEAPVTSLCAGEEVQ